MTGRPTTFSVTREEKDGHPDREICVHHASKPRHRITDGKTSWNRVQVVLESRSRSNPTVSGANVLPFLRITAST